MVASVPLNGPALLDFTVNGRGSRRAGFPPGNRAHWPGTPLVNNYRGPTVAPHNAYRTASRRVQRLVRHRLPLRRGMAAAGAGDGRIRPGPRRRNSPRSPDGLQHQEELDEQHRGLDA